MNYSENYDDYRKRLGMKTKLSPKKAEALEQTIYSGTPTDGNEVIALLYEANE
jgi:hypothetical protein